MEEVDLILHLEVEAVEEAAMAKAEEAVITSVAEEPHHPLLLILNIQVIFPVPSPLDP